MLFYCFNGIYMKECDNTYRKRSFTTAGGKLVGNSSLTNARYFSLDLELCLYLHPNWRTPCCYINQEVFGACPIIAFLWDLSFLEYLQISFKLCLPSCDSQDQPCHYTTSGHVKVEISSWETHLLLATSCYRNSTKTTSRIKV